MSPSQFSPSYGYTDTLDAEHYATALRADIRKGLTSTPKSTSPTWFYDARGSELFDPWPARNER